MRRGYAAGFILSILLIILALASLILLLRLLFRRPVPVPPTQPVPFAKMPRLAARAAPLFKKDPNRARAGVNDGLGASDSRLEQALFSSPPPLASHAAGQVAARTRLSRDLVRQCAGLLQKAGWLATVRQDRAGRAALMVTDVVARRRGRILALRCVPVVLPVDEEIIEQACLAREREHADVAAIVSAASFTFNAQKLALETGIELLHPDQLEDFARSIG